MNYYDIWFDARNSDEDLALADAIAAYLDHLAAAGGIEAWTLARRKLGLGPPELGEFHIRISIRDLAQLESAFQDAARRTGATQDLHARVYGAVRNLRFGLARDFPDPVRER